MCIRYAWPQQTVSREAVRCAELACVSSRGKPFINPLYNH